jgi:hypothetical protein
VLANASGDQAEATSAALERWLWPLRSDPTACVAGARISPQGGEIAVEVSRPEHARAYLAFPLASGAGGAPREAEWTAYLMNRPGGWLDQALRGVGEARARAAVLGGKNAAALLIEIQCAEADRAGAVTQMRSLWQRLAKGDASEADAELARRHFETRDAERALDPRGRVVELWRGTPPPRADLASLRRFQQALGAAKEIVVHAKARE